MGRPERLTRWARFISPKQRGSKDMTKISNWAQQFYARLGHDEEGATAVEYAVMLAVILAVAAATLTAVGTEITAIWGKVLALLQTANPG